MGGHRPSTPSGTSNACSGVRQQPPQAQTVPWPPGFDKLATRYARYRRVKFQPALTRGRLRQYHRGWCPLRSLTGSTLQPANLLP